MSGLGKLERIGKYDVLDLLGQGGMGVVYRARDPVIARQVAIKVILDRAMDAPAVRERFYREARSAGALSHENVMTIYDVGEDDGRPYIVMELLDGTDLRHVLGRRPLPSLDTRLDIAIQVCQGLGYAHSRGVVHRDIKPENVQVTTSGRVKLLDFGIARIQTETHTLTQAQIGTPRYMSPEQIKGEPIDGRTDIFSFGVLLYELLSGANPFAGEHITSVIYKVLHEDPPPPPLPDTPPGRDLQRIVARCMAKSPHRRFAKFAEVSDALRAVRNAGFDSTQEPPVAKPGLFGWLRRDTPIPTPPPIRSAHPGSTSSSTLPSAPPPLLGAADTGATVFAAAPPPLDATVILPREEPEVLQQPPPLARADTPSRATPPALGPPPTQADEEIDDDLLEGLVTGERRPVPLDEIVTEPLTEALESLTVDDPHVVAADANESDGAPAVVTDAAAAAAEAIDTDAGGVVDAPSAEALPEPGVPVPYLGAIAGVEVGDALREEAGDALAVTGEEQSAEAVTAEDDAQGPLAEEAPADEEIAEETGLVPAAEFDIDEGSRSASDDAVADFATDTEPAVEETEFLVSGIDEDAEAPAADAQPAEIEIEGETVATADETRTLDRDADADEAPASPDETYAFTPPALETVSETLAGPDETIEFEAAEMDEVAEGRASPDETFAFAPPTIEQGDETSFLPDETVEFAASDPEAEIDAPPSPDETVAFEIDEPASADATADLATLEPTQGSDEALGTAPPALEVAAEAPASPDETYVVAPEPVASPDETTLIEAPDEEAPVRATAPAPPTAFVPGPALGANARAAALDALGLMPPAADPEKETEATIVPPLPRARGGKGRRGRRDAPAAEDRPAEEAPASLSTEERRTDTGSLIPPLPPGPVRADTPPPAPFQPALRPPLASLTVDEPRPQRRGMLYAGAAVLSVLAVGIVYMGLRDGGDGEAAEGDATARHVDPVPPEGLVALGAAARVEMERMTVQRDSAAGAGVQESANFTAALALQTEAEEAFGRGAEADLRRATEAAREAAGLFLTARLSGTASLAELRERATQAERTAAAARQGALGTRQEPGATAPFDRGETALAAARRAVQDDEFAEAARLFGDAERAYRASRTAAAGDAARVASADVERQRVIAARARSRAMASASDGPLLASAEREYSGAARSARNRNYRAALAGYENAARLYGQATRAPTRPTDPTPDPPGSVLTPGTPPADVIEASRRTDAARSAASGNTGSAAYRQGERARAAAGVAMRNGDYAEARSLYAGARAAFEEAGRGRVTPPERETVVSPVPSIGQYAADLQRAFENENLGALRAFHPYFNRYSGLFENADDIHATVSTAPPDISGTRATVAVTLSLRYQASGRSESPPPVRLRWTLEQRGSTWRLVDVASR